MDHQDQERLLGHPLGNGNRLNTTMAIAMAIEITTTATEVMEAVTTMIRILATAFIIKRQRQHQ
jgi:hypothetical protein